MESFGLNQVRWLHTLGTFFPSLSPSVSPCYSFTNFCISVSCEWKWGPASIQKKKETVPSRKTKSKRSHPAEAAAVHNAWDDGSGNRFRTAGSKSNGGRETGDVAQWFVGAWSRIRIVEEGMHPVPAISCAEILGWCTKIRPIDTSIKPLQSPRNLYMFFSVKLGVKMSDP